MPHQYALEVAPFPSHPNGIITVAHVRSLAILSWHCGWLHRGADVPSHKAAHLPRPILRDLAVLCAPTLSRLQEVVQEKSASLVALSFDNLPQLRPRSNPALTVEYTLELMSALGQSRHFRSVGWMSAYHLTAAE